MTKDEAISILKHFINTSDNTEIAWQLDGDVVIIKIGRLKEIANG